MSNQLIKTAERSYIPGTPGVAGDPGQPARAGYWYSLPVTYSISGKSSAGYSSSYVYSVIQDPDTQAYYVVGTPNSTINSGGGVTTSWSASGAFAPTGVQVWVPPQPYIAPTPPVAPTPTQTIIDNKIGWNAGASSVQPLNTDGEYTFFVTGGTTGAVVGLSATIDTDYRLVEHGLFFRGQVVSVMESGALVTASAAFVTTDEWTIKRVRGTVTYLKNGTPFHTSAVSSGDTKLLVANLYTAGDEVYDAALDTYHVGYVNGSMLPMYGVAYETASNYANGFMAPMTGSATAATHGTMDGTMPALIGKAAEINVGYAYSSTSMPALEGNATAGLIAPVVHIADGVMVQMTGYAHGLTGEIGDASGSMPALIGKAGETGYAYSSTSMPALEGYGFEMVEPYVARYSEVLLAYEAYNAGDIIVMVYSETGEISDVYGVSITAIQPLSETIIADIEYSVLETITLAYGETVVIYDNLTASGVTIGDDAFGTETPTTATWVVNIETNASAKYDNFAFTSMTLAAGRALGTLSDGVYVLEGSDDAGTEIDTTVDLGDQGFGSTFEKRVPYAYLGVASDNRMILKVTVGGKDYYYRSRAYDAALRTQRVDIGRGLRGTFFGFELTNQEGGDFELESIRFVPVPLSRRIP